MRKTDIAKMGIGAIGAGIIGYGLYSMKKDTEKFLEGPGNFLGGVLGGSGLPEDKNPMNSLNEFLTKLNPFSQDKQTEPSKYVETPADTTFAGDIKSHRQAVSLGLGMAPLAVNVQSDFKKSEGLYFPALEAGPATKYTEKTSSSSSSKSYTDSTGRTYAPTNVIEVKAKWL